MQILDLQSRISSLESELECTSPIDQKVVPTSWLPGSNPKHTLNSHGASITSIAFHPECASVASASEDNTIKIWDRQIGVLERTLRGHQGAVTGLDFGGLEVHTLFASCSNDSTIRIWDPSSHYKNMHILHGHIGYVSAVRFLTPTDTLLVSAGRDTSIRIWEVLVGTCLRTIRTGGEWIRDLAPSHEGGHLISAGKDNAPTIWETSSGRLKAVLLGHDNTVECCAFAPPTSFSNFATLVSIDSVNFKSSSEIRGSTFLATGSRDKTIKLWNDRGILIKTLIGHDCWVRGLAFHPGGRYLISVGEDATLRCWDLSDDAKLVKTIDGLSDCFVTCVRWGPKEIHRDHGISYALAVGSDDACLRIWN